jgi:hypothetical protein
MSIYTWSTNLKVFSAKRKGIVNETKKACRTVGHGNCGRMSVDRSRSTAGGGRIQI